MKFGHAEVESIQRIVSSHATARLLHQNFSAFSLGATFELACCHWAWKGLGVPGVMQLTEKWIGEYEILRSAIINLARRGILRVNTSELFAAPRYEICPVPLFGEWDDTQWSMFQDRFRRTLVSSGFGSKVALALSKALWEMADNVTQHSGRDEYDQANGIVGYHAENGSMTFAVADVGRGVLESLRTSPRWKSTPNGRAALEEAILAKATRRLNVASGGGFQNVLVAIADLNGTLRFRSGDACLMMDGRGDARKTILSFVPDLVGFQLTVTCSLSDLSPAIWI